MPLQGHIVMDLIPVQNHKAIAKMSNSNGMIGEIETSSNNRLKTRHNSIDLPKSVPKLRLMSSCVGGGWMMVRQLGCDQCN